MAAPEVVRVIDALSIEAVTVGLEGGWGVDALLREVTREHNDLDLALGAGDVPAAQAALERLGYSVVPGADPGIPARLVLAPASGTVDLHPLVFDGGGNGWLQLSPTARSWSCHWRRGPRGNRSDRRPLCAVHQRRVANGVSHALRVAGGRPSRRAPFG